MKNIYKIVLFAMLNLSQTAFANTVFSSGYDKLINDLSVIIAQKLPSLLFEIEISNNFKKISNDFKIKSLELEGDNYTFKALITYQNTNIEIDGKIIEKILVPVLKQNLSANSRITKNNLKFILQNKNTLSNDTILKISDLDGFYTSSAILSEHAIKNSDIKNETLIKKDQIVSLIYKKNNLMVSRKAKSKQDLHKNESGEFIILNKDEKKSESAKVIVIATAIKPYTASIFDACSE